MRIRWHIDCNLYGQDNGSKCPKIKNAKNSLTFTPIIPLTLFFFPRGTAGTPSRNSSWIKPLANFLEVGQTVEYRLGKILFPGDARRIVVVNPFFGGSVACSTVGKGSDGFSVQHFRINLTMLTKDIWSLRDAHGRLISYTPYNIDGNFGGRFLGRIGREIPFNDTSRIWIKLGIITEMIRKLGKYFFPGSCWQQLGLISKSRRRTLLDKPARSPV